MIPVPVFIFHVSCFLFLASCFLLIEGPVAAAASYQFEIMVAVYVNSTEEPAGKVQLGNTDLQTHVRNNSNTDRQI